MTKKSGISAKASGERAPSLTRDELLAAVPIRPLEPVKAYIPRAATDLQWTPRRVRAWWNNEARRLDHFEMVTLHSLKERAKENERRLRDLRDDIADLRRGSAASRD